MKTPLLLLLAAALMGVVTACSADTVQTKTAVPEVTDAAVEAEPGEEIVMQTRHAFDGTARQHPVPA